MHRPRSAKPKKHGAKRNGDRALLTPPALGEGCCRSLARRLVAVDRRAVFVVTVGERPEPWRAHGRGGSFHDAADDLALTQHVVVVLAPLAGQAGSRRAFVDKLSDKQRCDL